MERFFSNPSNAPRRDADTDTGITLLSGPPCWYAPHCSPCPAQTSPFWHALRRDRNGSTVDLSTPSDHAVPLFWCKVSGKTSLLFQFAVNRAAESGRGVVFICSKGRLESNPPFLSQGVDPSMSLLQRIQIKYIEDVDDIRKYFAAFHLLDDFPAAVIVDDFADFFSERSCQQRYGTTRARDLAMVRVLALCHNAIGHANAKLGTLGSCNLLLSDVHQGDTPRSLFIYQRWINSIYTIRGDGKGSYILQNIGSSETGSKKAIKAKYSIALQYLALEETSN